MTDPSGAVAGTSTRPRASGDAPSRTRDAQGTKVLVPSRRQPSPAGVAVVAGTSGARATPGSASAAVRKRRPAMTSPNSAPRWASVPNSATAMAPATIEARYGTGAAVRPISVRTNAAPMHAVASAADLGGQADAEQIGLGQLGPGVGREPLDWPAVVTGGLFEVAQGGVGDLVAQDLGGQVRDGLLVVAEGEVHGSLRVLSVGARGACRGRTGR